MPTRYTVTLSDGAKGDLDDLHRYVAEHRSLEAADGLLDRLMGRAASLETFPLKGSVPKELEELGRDGYRQIVLPPYRLIYRVTDTTVFVTIIADGRRDMVALLTHRLVAG